jgi:hypothetical protein
MIFRTFLDTINKPPTFTGGLFIAFICIICIWTVGQ